MVINPFAHPKQIPAYWLILGIIVIATWLRVWQLDTLAIFIGDAGHDIQSAITAVENKTIPLLGIESSVPRFKQGPLAVWLHMIIHLAAGKDIYWHWLVFSLLGVAAVIAVYEFCQLYLSPKVSLLASWLVAISPLAIAHSRMAYHITPIPLMLILFLVANVRLAQAKKYSLFWVALSWAGVFQFELAVAPLILVPLFTLAKQKQLFKTKTYPPLLLGLVVGLLPQIIVDLTTRFSHLGGFLIWVVYRVVSLAPTGKHSFSLETLAIVSERFQTFAGRVFAVDQPLILLFFSVLLFFTLYFNWGKYIKGKLPIGIEVVFTSTLVLVAGFIIHGGPSEAYFPPFIVLLPLLVAYGWSQLKKPLSILVLGGILLTSFITITAIFHQQFFVGRYSGFAYGYSISEQRQVVQFAITESNNSYQFLTTQPDGIFPNYFDNLRVLAWATNSQESTQPTHQFFIEPKNSPLSSYPNAYRASFNSVDMYQLH